MFYSEKSGGGPPEHGASEAGAITNANTPERISKILSAHGVASRREAEIMIAAGRVHVNGELATLGQKACDVTDVITVDGMPLRRKDEPVYIMLNKPRGYLTTMKDQRGRKTVLSLVTDSGARVYPVGRLDMDSEGLLLMTNDGGFANRVCHPSNNKLKTYEVRVRGDAAAAVFKLGLPMEVDAYVIRAASVKLVSGGPEGGVLNIGIFEGRNRQIRKMCVLCGLWILSLKRLSIGEVNLGELETGRWRYLTGAEVASFGVKN